MAQHIEAGAASRPRRGPAPAPHMRMVAHRAPSTEQQRRTPRRAIRRWAALSVLAALAVAAGLHFGVPREVQAGRTAIKPAGGLAAAPIWTPVPQAAPVFELAGADPRLTLARYAAQQAPATGAREDQAVYGRFETGPYLSLVLVRGDDAAPRSHFVEIARRAAQAGLSVARLGRPAAIQARFAGLQGAEMQLTDGKVGRACLSFRVREAELGIGLVGWSCDDGPREAAGQRLLCLLDAMRLTGADADLNLQVVFAQAERQAGPACPKAVEARAAAPMPAAPMEPRAGKAGTRHHVSSRTNHVASF